MTAPSTFYAGDLVVWTDARPPAEATAVVGYLRTNTAGQGVTVTATQAAAGEPWEFRIEAGTSGAMEPGEWLLQVVATLPDGPFTYAPLQRILVRAGLAYTGTPDAFDGRSTTELELIDVRNAIQAVYRSLEYTIGTADGGRKVRRADLPWLQDREQLLLKRLAAERRAASGRDRRLLTYFPND